jgi:hypothetical protein
MLLATHLSRYGRAQECLPDGSASAQVPEPAIAEACLSFGLP